MPDGLTNAAAAALNAARRIKGLNRPLRLIDHSVSDPGDYQTIATVTRGFLISSTPDGIELQVTESAEATPELLARMTGCVFDDRYYKIRGTDKLKPLGAPLLWRFALTPTGETVL